RAAVCHHAVPRGVVQCARRASRPGWRGFGSWSCRPRGNSPAAGWPAASRGWGRQLHTCAERILINRSMSTKSGILHDLIHRLISGYFNSLSQKVGKVRVRGYQRAEPFVAKPAPESSASTEQLMEEVCDRE